MKHIIVKRNILAEALMTRALHQQSAICERSLPTIKRLATCAVTVMVTAATIQGSKAQAIPAPGITQHAAVYLNVPGDPFSFMGAGVSPRDGKPQFGAGFAFTERVFVTGMRMSYDSGHFAAGAWGWSVTGELGGQPRFDAVATHGHL